MKKIITLLSVLLMMSACTKDNGELERYSRTTTTSGFDTTITLLAYTKDEKEFNHYFELMSDKFWEYHMQFDKYNAYKDINNIKTINDNAGIQAVEVSDEIMDLITLSKEYTSQSDYFDITYGSVFRVWHDYREEGMELNANGEAGNIPTEKELKEAETKVGWDKVEIDEDNKTIFLKEKGMELDVGAIAKGYATEMVARYLEEEGLKHAIVSGGGNIRTINAKPDGPWKIGIQEPSEAIDSPSVDVFEFEESISVVTSGDYQRTYIGPDNTSYSHLINPKTLYPQTEFRSVTIITKDSITADVMSTTLFMMDYEEAQTFIEKHNKENPDNPISVFWIVDENKDWYQGENFDYMMTEDLIPLSKNLNEKSQ